MNSQEIIIKISKGDSQILQTIEKKFPLILINNNSGMFLHPKLGSFFIEKGRNLILSKSFFPKPTLDDYYELGKLAKMLSNLNVQYNIFLAKNQERKVLFEHEITEKFYS